MSDTETVICCIIVSNPAGGTRPRGWQKRVNDHIRSLAKMAALQPDAAVLQEEAEIDALRLKAFWTNAAADRDAYFAAVSVWFQNRHGRALPAVQPDAREAALREAALQDAISHVRQALIDAAHTHGSIVTTRSSAMFTAEIIATNALSRLLSASTGKEVMPDVSPNKPQFDTAPVGNLTARGNAATWALYDANLTRMGALQPSHVNETPKSEHDREDVLTPATKGGGA